MNLLHASVSTNRSGIPVVIKPHWSVIISGPYNYDTTAIHYNAGKQRPPPEQFIAEIYVRTIYSENCNASFQLSNQITK
jgi:hypothetical protein